MHKLFRDRIDAGHDLARALAHYKAKPDTLILALPRGGVPVAHEVARELSLPMDIWLVRKLGMPGHEELALGAIAVGEALYLNPRFAAILDIKDIEPVIAREKKELARRNELYRQGRPAPDVAEKTVIVIDDGIATGATMRAAVESLRQLEARHIVAAAPTGAASSCEELAATADEVVCPHQLDPFYGVGLWYEDFSQTSDEEVQNLLGRRA